VFFTIKSPNVCRLFVQMGYIEGVKSSRFIPSCQASSMPNLQLRKSSKWWYGYYRRNGKVFAPNLQVEVAGRRPESLKDAGDAAFERSRGQAQAVLDRILRDLDDGRQQEELAQQVYRAKYGQKLSILPLKELSDYWERIPRKRPPTPRYVSQCRMILQSFVDWMKKHHPDVKDVGGVIHEVAEAYMRNLDDGSITNRTWNQRLGVLRGVFKRLQQQNGIGNPFVSIVTKEEDTVFRIPFQPEELRDVLAATAKDPLIAPIAVTAACTAMRLGDCCMLRWDQVDLEEGFVTVKTSKTGATVDIPLFPMLYDEINKRRDNDSVYVFPDQAQQYRKNQSLLSDRLRRALADCGFHDGKGMKLKAKQVPEAEVRAKAEAMFAEMPDNPRYRRMAKEFELYMAGKTTDEICEKLQVSKSVVSRDLNEIETRIELPFIRGKTRKPKKKPKGEVSASRKNGRQASTRDWHSFRTTWITLALIGNIPLELVRRVTGHQTVDVVMKHYFRPQREQLKSVLMNMMPKLLVDGAASTTDQAVVVLEKALAADDLDSCRSAVQEALEVLSGSEWGYTHPT
jgi:integrase